MSNEPNCPCDVFVHPAPLAIDAGLSTIPRQIATFPQFRHAMLSALPTKAALASWRARGDEDLGVMLIEMWAYVCDVLAFYDETIAHETYLRTARLSPSVRKLVGLLGYRPRPAVAAHAHLALRADGRQPIALPAGLAFRSSAFAGEPPQVFELDADARAHPLLNGWNLAPVRPTIIAEGTTTLLFTLADARAQEGDHLVLVAGGTFQPDPYTVQTVQKIVGSDGDNYLAVSVNAGLAFDLLIATARLLRPTAKTSLWFKTTEGPSGPAFGGNTITLSGVVPQIQPDDYLVIRGTSFLRAVKVTAVKVELRTLIPQTTVGTSPNPTAVIPAVQVPVTVVTFAPNWTLDGSLASTITIEYGSQNAGTLTAELSPRIQPADPLVLLPPIEAPPDGTQPGSFLIDDADGTSLELAGGVNFATRVLTPAAGSERTVDLDPPANVYANVVPVTRGETVPSETLGSGDASAANQSFTLKKKPLTYVSTPTGADPNGVANTLTIWVRGIEWQEVPSFYGIAPDATVYVVRQNDDGDSTVIFGDGVRGSRLPTGATVAARYRFGAGAASPPSGSIIQLAKPVKGITSVKNPVAASGGADTEPASQVRSYAPRSALLFGRAVSIKDMEALVAGQPGVQAVQAQWMWDANLQLPAVQLWYIGPASIASSVSSALHAATAPATPIVASNAQPIAATLVVEVRVDPRYVRDRVAALVQSALAAPVTGLLSAERIGIGAPLFRSRVLAEVLAVDGVTSVQSILWQGAAFDDYGVQPVAGTWFQVSVTINATEDPNG